MSRYTKSAASGLMAMTLVLGLSGKAAAASLREPGRTAHGDGAEQRARCCVPDISGVRSATPNRSSISIRT